MTILFHTKYPYKVFTLITNITSNSQATKTIKDAYEIPSNTRDNGPNVFSSNGG